jgi:hypothetical protein
MPFGEGLRDFGVDFPSIQDFGDTISSVIKEETA